MKKSFSPFPFSKIFNKKIYFNICSIYRQFSQDRAYPIIIIGVIKMISYEPFYKTLREKNISTYKLINTYGVSRSLLDRLKHNKPISTVTLNDLCTFLDCRVEDILIYKKDL